MPSRIHRLHPCIWKSVETIYPLCGTRVERLLAETAVATTRHIHLFHLLVAPFKLEGEASRDQDVFFWQQILSPIAIQVSGRFSPYLRCNSWHPRGPSHGLSPRSLKETRPLNGPLIRRLEARRSSLQPKGTRMNAMNGVIEAV